MNADRPGNVLDGMLAQVLEPETQFVANLVVHIARNENAPRFGESLQACRDVDAVAIDIVAVADDVADIDADAELNAALRRHLGIALGHASLHVDRAAHRIDYAREFQQQAVAGRLDDAAVMFGDLGVDQCFSSPLRAGGCLPRRGPSIGYSQQCRPLE